MSTTSVMPISGAFLGSDQTDARTPSPLLKSVTPFSRLDHDAGHVQTEDDGITVNSMGGALSSDQYMFRRALIVRLDALTFPPTSPSVSKMSRGSCQFLYQWHTRLLIGPVRWVNSDRLVLVPKSLKRDCNSRTERRTCLTSIAIFTFLGLPIFDRANLKWCARGNYPGSRAST
jgi:hypothetical protein